MKAHETELQRMRNASGNVTSKNPLVTWFYWMLRDGKISPSDIEACADGVLTGRESVFTNGWLARYAEDIVSRLMAPEPLADNERTELEFLRRWVLAARLFGCRPEDVVMHGGEPRPTFETATRFRKKPIVIQAYRTDVELEIPTLEGVMKANVGDWILTGVNGEKYPCKNEIFVKTYEPVE